MIIAMQAFSTSVVNASAQNASSATILNLFHNQIISTMQDHIALIWETYVHVSLVSCK